ncbi:MAG: type II secretion system minor pseudopilin GspJ [Pseudomonadota bacterium]
MTGERGFSIGGRCAEHGFTLIELMVALAIFAMLSAAGVILLSGSVSAQGAVAGKLDRLAAVQRAASVMTVDLAQAVPRISRTETGTLAPAFFAGGAVPGQPAVQFVRTGWDNLDGLPRSSLQKLEYAVVEGRLERRGYPLVDGAAATAPAVLLDNVAGAGFRFRDDRGNWLNEWRVSDPKSLPRAVELTVTRVGADPIRMLFLVGAEPPVKDGADG